jgi:hypothetical protein
MTDSSLVSRTTRERAAAWGDKERIITAVISGSLIEVPPYEE